MDRREFQVQVRVDPAVLETWIAEGWVLPEEGQPIVFADVDVARAGLIRDLRDDFGVNDEAIPIILHLIDQVHGLRRMLRALNAAMEAREPK
jgi:chaperone modulatory protein CbpM